MLTQPKKWPRYIVLAIVAWFVVQNPASAAHLANHAGELISQGADALGRFASALHTG